MIDENVAPIAKAGVDFSSVSPSPTPEQYFLLSRVDGKLTVGELCQISGLGRQKTLAALEVLATAGVIDIPGYQPAVSDSAGSTGEQANKDREREREKEREKETGGRKKKKKKKRAVVPNYPVAPEAFDFDPDLLAADVPLDEERRKEVICLYSQIDQMTFYDIFGLEPGASRKDIKKAYFRMSKRYHPDKFFRKEMGAFGPMLEGVFKEITKAYRTLSSKRKRSSYDEALAAEQSRPEMTGGAASPSRSSHADASATQEEKSEENKRKAAAVLLMRRAEKLEEQGDLSAAAGEYRKALALNRDAALALRVARTLLDAGGHVKEARSFVRAARKLGAAEVNIYLLLGRTAEQAGDDDQAVEHYRRVLEHAADHPQATARIRELRPGESV